jgi:hypothetical protein
MRCGSVSFLARKYFVAAQKSASSWSQQPNAYRSSISHTGTHEDAMHEDDLDVLMRSEGSVASSIALIVSFDREFQTPCHQSVK